MTVLEKIKATGGFVCFATINSMPLGYYKNGDPMTSDEYYEARKLIAKGLLKGTGQRMTNETFKKYLTNNIVEGDLYT